MSLRLVSSFALHSARPSILRDKQLEGESEGVLLCGQAFKVTSVPILVKIHTSIHHLQLHKCVKYVSAGASTHKNTNAYYLLFL